MTHGSPGQNLDGVEEIGKVPRTVRVGHDVVFQVPRGLGLPEEDHALRPVRQRVTTSVMLQISSLATFANCNSVWLRSRCSLQKALSKLADMLVSLSQDVKYPLPSIPTQQIFVTEVRDEKLGISSQRSPQEHAVPLERDICCAQTLSQRAAVVAPGLFRMISVPFWRRAFVKVLLRFTVPL